MDHNGSDIIRFRIRYEAFGRACLGPLPGMLKNYTAIVVRVGSSGGRARAVIALLSIYALSLDSLDRKSVV